MGTGRKEGKKERCSVEDSPWETQKRQVGAGGEWTDEEPSFREER